jgi:phosphopantetheinyl transferase (holo-ACP synthase)
MIGNDIIDINETRNSTNWERPGLRHKIFTTKEQHAINASADPFTIVWHFWSMKESAYKLFIQAGGKQFFNPKKFECQLDSSKNGQVKIVNTIVNTSTSINSNYIFTTATINNCDLDTRIFKFTKNNSKHQSNFMYQQILKDFAKNNSLHFTDLNLQKTKTGVPKLHYQNKLLNTSLSISHHGEYGAYSIIKD